MGALLLAAALTPQPLGAVEGSTDVAEIGVAVMMQTPPFTDKTSMKA